MTRTAPLLAAALWLAACATTPDPFRDAQRIDPRPLETLSSFLTGTFESIPPKDTLRIVRLWPGRPAEYWFYEAFERSGEEGRPYLQRLVRIGMTGEATMQTVAYGLPGEASRFAGAWRNPGKAFADIDPKVLREAPNCRQQVEVQNLVAYAGGTVGKACQAHVPPGTYEISDFLLTSSSIRTWNRGYDATGKVVWGSPAGPLDLRRTSTEAK